MKFLDKNFLKVTFQFLLVVFLGVVLITYVSGLKYGNDATAGVVGSQ